MWCESATTSLQTLHGSILTLNASIVCAHNPPWLHFEPVKLLNFDADSNPDRDPAFHSNADPDQNSENNPDPDSDPQPLL